MDVVLAGGVTRAVMSTSGECNVFDDARAASSSISAADKENNKEGGDTAGMLLYCESSLKGRGMAQVPWLSQDELGALHYKECWLRRPFSG